MTPSSIIAAVCNTFDIKKRTPYYYKTNREKFKIHLNRTQKGIKFFHLTYKSPIVSPFKENNTVFAQYIEPEEVKSAAIFLHGLGVNNMKRWTYLAQFLARQKIASLLIELPYHIHRTPMAKKSGELFILANAIKTFNHFEQAVLDVRKGIDFLEQRNFSKIGIIGTSLGSMISLIAQSFDKRIKKSVLILSGGDIELLKWRSPAMWKVRKAHLRIGVNHRVCIKNRKPIPSFIKKIKEGNPIDKIQAPVACFYFEPLAFAPLVKRENVLMINGLFDIIIPKTSTIKLWHALKKPQIVWYPLSHFTIYLAYYPITRRISKFLKY
ncbi:MAG: hypothetical protein B5M53_06930 [Candidatus Cloacimonas sp. 4484_209]|nr:MAG: hypothetical protein B5M53_06930 [Candidatus Cloacimonas sp. 4484_209]